METTTKSAKVPGKQKQQKVFIHKYLIDCIYGEDDNGQEITFKSDKDAINYAFATFESTHGWLIERIGEFQALTECLQGLPSWINIAFMNYDILELAKEQGTLPQDATEKQEDRILESYWRYMAMRLRELRTKLNR